jgi:hypothetical protein
MYIRALLHSGGFPVGRTSTTSIHPSDAVKLLPGCWICRSHTYASLAPYNFTTHTQRPGIFLISFSVKFLSIKSCPGFHCHSPPPPSSVASKPSAAPRSNFRIFIWTRTNGCALLGCPFAAQMMCAGVAGKQTRLKQTCCWPNTFTFPCPPPPPRRTEFGQLERRHFPPTFSTTRYRRCRLHAQ